MQNCELVEQITGNSYLRYFIDFPGYQEEASLIRTRWCSYGNVDGGKRVWL